MFFKFDDTVLFVEFFVNDVSGRAFATIGGDCVVCDIVLNVDVLDIVSLSLSVAAIVHAYVTLSFNVPAGNVSIVALMFFIIVSSFASLPVKCILYLTQSPSASVDGVHVGVIAARASTVLSPFIGFVIDDCDGALFVTVVMASLKSVMSKYCLSVCLKISACIPTFYKQYLLHSAIYGRC